VVEPLPVAPPVAVAAPPMMPLAGYANGSFFLRDPHDWFVLFPKGRLQIDWYNFLNRGDAPAGVVPNSGADPRPKDTLFVRRARVELQGTFIGHFDFHIAGEFTTTPASGSLGALADAYIIADYLSWLKVQVGQFDAPFSLENRTSDKYLDFIERGPTIRFLAVPPTRSRARSSGAGCPSSSPTTRSASSTATARTSRTATTGAPSSAAPSWRRSPGCPPPTR